MKKAVTLAVAVTASALALLLGGLSIRRAALPYNEEGRYFDAAQSVVYTDGAVVTYGLLALLCAAAALWAWSAWRP